MSEEKNVSEQETKTLSEVDANKLRLGVAKAARCGFVALSKLTDEEILSAFDKPSETPAYTEAVNEAYQGVLEAELPQVFNNHIDSLARGVIERMFTEIADKSNRNLITLIEQTTGLDYDDMTPKQVVDLIESNKVK